MATPAPAEPAHATSDLDHAQPCLPMDACPIKAPLGMRIVTFLAVLLPLLGLTAAMILLWQTPFHWVYLMLMGAMYLLTMLGIGVGYHRLFTHKSFETSAGVRLLWGALGSMAVEGPVLKWTAMHRKHHQHTDAPGDPHSPHVHSGAQPGDHDDHHHPSGSMAILRGLWHAHIGWMFEKDPPDLDRYVPDLAKDRVVVFLDRTFVLWVIAGLLLPAAVAGIITQSWLGVILGFLWGGLVRVLLVHHVTWCVNSVCHLWGLRPFRTGDQSRDNPILGYLALGEGWHNTHHAFPTSARHGLSWWKFDLNYLAIRVMELLHVARNVRRPAPERIAGQRRGLPPTRPA